MINVVNLCILRPNLKEILLIQREKEPYKNYWGMPGGKCESNERTDLAGARELKEETGIRRKPRFPMGLCYERVWERGEVIYAFSINFIRFVTNAKVRRKNSEGELRWFKLSELERIKVIPSDPKIIQSFCSNRVNYVTSDISKKGDLYILESFCENSPKFRKVV